ncbi:MAG: DUF362 domain-containing protein [Anaerolineae bacterium]|nr:DUF362 domain-containing protein [Anaerolineae bacterium]
MKKLSRREFLRLSGAVGAAAGWAMLGTGCSDPLPMASPQQAGATQPSSRSIDATQDAVASPTRQPTMPTSDQAYLAVARGEDPAGMVNAALAALGGIERFVSQGNDVIIKPNICVAYHTPEYAVTTNPQVVAALVTLCLGAGAKRVRVMDQGFGGTATAAYAISGIEEAVKAAGGEMEVMSSVKYADFDIPDGKDITSWEFYRDIMETDVLINVPIAKHHSLARLTLGGKNLLGIITNPSRIHQNMGQRVADLVSAVRPSLTVIDGYRILMANGPTGGNLDDVKQARTIIASHDIVAADAYATTLFDLTGEDIDYVKNAADMGLGTMDLSSIKIEEIAI